MFSFPHKTEEQWAEQYNSYGKLYGFLPVYFTLVRNGDEWGFGPSEDGRAVIEEANWVPRWLFRLVAMFFGHTIIARSILGGDECPQLPIYWYRWVGKERENDPVPYEEDA